MKSAKGNDFEEKSDCYLKRVGDRYIYDSSSGLYRQQADGTEKNGKQQSAANSKSLPFWVEVRRDWLILCVSVLTLLGLGVTVFYTRRQWVEANKSAEAAARTADEARKANMKSQLAIDQARDQFRLDQRPYVAETPKSTGSPQFIPNPIHPDQGGQIVWDFHYSDFGKTPAYRFSHKSFIRLDGKSFVRSFGEPKQKQEIVLPPSSDVYNTVVSAPISRIEFDRLMKIDHGIEFRAVFSYQDSYGTWYETGICESHLVLGATQYCEGNYIK